MRTLDAIFAVEKEKASARAHRYRQRYADVAMEHARTVGARQGVVPVNEDRLADNLDEVFVGERVFAPLDRIEDEDLTLRHGVPNEAIYGEDGYVREDIDLSPELLDILLLDAPQGIEEPFLYCSVTELEDDSQTLEEYIEELEAESEEQ